MRKGLLSILVVAVLVAAVAGGASWWFSIHGLHASTQLPASDGPTLYQAIAEANSSIASTSGGPWGLFSIYGVAAQSNYSPNVEGYPLENQTVNACQSQFPGLTLWNGTMPVFNGSLDSGTAPFWQFGYFSNATDQVLLATNTLGSVHVYPPMSSDGPCSPWSDLGNPENWVKLLDPFLPNSPNLAQAALAQIGQKIGMNWIDRFSPTVELYTSGPGVFDLLGDLGGAAGIIFERCGLSGVTGLQPLLQWGESLQGTNGSFLNGTTNCAMLNQPYFAGYGTYDLEPASTNETTLPGTDQIRSSFQVAMVSHNGSAPTSYDGWGLANWMTSWNLTSASGQHLPPATPGCRSWVPAATSCLANVSGWYVVILSAAGEWVNSYGALPNGGNGWVVPVTALVSHQQVVIVFPSAWNVTGDSLGVFSTVSTSSVTGAFPL